MADLRVASPARRAFPCWLSAWQDLLAWVSLAGAVLAVCWPLGLTNRILAGVDAFTYFMPYWAHRIAELRAGHLPLWNPYLFLGVPFLANPQAAVLYPPHWLLNGLESSQALIWSALLHLWLAAGLMYCFGRRSVGLSRPAAWLAAALFALGGFTLGKIENINQLNALAWLPGLLWLYDVARRSEGWRGRVRWGAFLSGMIALLLLAGHTQTAFVNLVGLGIYAIFGGSANQQISKSANQQIGKSANRQIGNSRICILQFAICNLQYAFRRLSARLWPLLAIFPALALAAAQLLPALELSNLGLRTGGLTYRLAVSFSLRPRLLAQTLLPPLGGGLAEAFGSEGYAEFTGYIGVAGLILAGVGVAGLLRRGAADRRISGGPRRDALRGLAILAGVGIFLALGAYNPVYYFLWRFVPGFDLFRAPARWLALYAFAAAGLAGAGLDLWRNRATSSTSRGLQGAEPRQDTLRVSEARRTLRASGGHVVSGRSRRMPAAVTGWMALSLLALLFFVFQQLPGAWTLLGWAGAALLAAGFLWVGWRWPRPAVVGLIALVLVELWLAGRALPFALATAPAAGSLRNAPAALLAATAAQPSAGRDRFLSMSDIRYDPGDLAELRALQADRLSADAVERFVRAAKWTEVIAPNLSIPLRLPAIDGYDGGVLPIADYGRLQTLFLPEDARLPDGRLREQLRAIPPDRLLDLTGVRFIITDKQHDLWAGDVYYDLEQVVTLRPGERLTLDLAGYPPFSAAALGVAAEAGATAGPGAAAPAEIGVVGADGRTAALRLAAPVRGAGEMPQPVLLTLPVAMTPTQIAVAIPADATSSLTLRGLSLVDGRTGAHQSITLSPRGDLRRIHSGDVKVYERTAAPGRAWLVHGAQPAAGPDEALRRLADPGFDPRTTVLVAGDFPAAAPAAAGPDESVQVIAYAAERIVLRAEVRRPALLVLADAFFPGWQATVDGAAAPILRANLMFRAVALEPGAHEIVFSYDPAAWRTGAAISLAALAVLALACVASVVSRLGTFHVGPSLRGPSFGPKQSPPPKGDCSPALHLPVCAGASVAKGARSDLS